LTAVPLFQYTEGQHGRISEVVAVKHNPLIKTLKAAHFMAGKAATITADFMTRRKEETP
jgi:hypothetical protein